MIESSPDGTRRATEYAQERRLVIADPLGFGVHGSVFACRAQHEETSTAVKIHLAEPAYRRERDAYERLADFHVTEILGHAVPQLLNADDRLWILEITIVSRPFLLDFGGAYLDHPPEFSHEVWAEWRAEKREQFGLNWPHAEAILRALERYGLYMIDVNPGNIGFESDPNDDIE